MLSKTLLLFVLLLPLAVNALDRNKIDPIRVEINNATCDSLQLVQSIIKKFSIVQEDIKIDTSTDIYDESVLVSATDTTIQLTCQDTVVIFEDMPEDEYGYYSYFHFIGQLQTNGIYAPFIIEAHYAEYEAILLINNITGMMRYFY